MAGAFFFHGELPVPSDYRRFSTGHGQPSKRRSGEKWVVLRPP